MRHGDSHKWIGCQPCPLAVSRDGPGAHSVLAQKAFLGGALPGNREEHGQGLARGYFVSVSVLALLSPPSTERENMLAVTRVFDELNNRETN